MTPHSIGRSTAAGTVHCNSDLDNRARTSPPTPELRLRSTMASPDRPHYIPLPPPLRSAMKQSSSRPNTPNTVASSSPNLRASPLSPPLSGVPLGSPALSSSTLPTFASTTPASQSPYSQVPASTNASSTVVTMGSPNTPASPLIAAQGYTPKVSFDTLENPVASMFSYTLHVQSEGYVRLRSTRVFLCASSPDESGRQALDWCLESLVQDGDELVVFRGVDPDDFGKRSELGPLGRCPFRIPGSFRSQRRTTMTSTARTRAGSCTRYRRSASSMIRSASCRSSSSISRARSRRPSTG